jgi:hypothetical protein
MQGTTFVETTLLLKDLRARWGAKLSGFGGLEVEGEIPGPPNSLCHVMRQGTGQFELCVYIASYNEVFLYSANPYLLFSIPTLDNSDLHFVIKEDGLGGCGIATEGFANLWAAARATWGVKGGKYYFEMRVESNVEVDLASEDHPHALRY